ncbi:histidinol-phosphate aminotransferase [Sulfurifustis variabilis]|uniref:Histidinol-phosphate aminotransferase n=1 Tax=Sulfurifustis variabilis TaxID=1675686 RepID=A0A1B4V5B1_9GAMM|nr:histidinol-phosphate transaminase [Sulfurifustis variabilis]BAU48625.1 histidinol-phosphate aminotransferase [Sulfurifustis variabilis]
MTFEPIALAAPGVRRLSPYQPGKPLDALEREYGVRNAIKLASNENPLGPGPAAVAAARAALEGVGRYPDGAGFGLKRALAARLGVDAMQITLGNGSNDVLELVARAFLGPDTEVVYAAHAFAVYALVTQAAGARAVVVPARDWGHDLDAMRAAVGPRTRLVFIANPNNPTGTWLRAGDLEGFVRAVPENVLVVVDEAYFEYVDEPDYPDTVGWIAKYPNLITTRTFSKIHGLAGLRVGYGVSHPAVADLLNRVRQPFNVNSAAAAAAEAALRDEAHVARSRDMNRAGLRQLTEGTKKLGLPHIPSTANFVCIEVGQAAAVYEGLLREGVIVRPVANYGMPRHLRVTVGLPEENERFLKALDKVLGGSRR